MSESAPSLLQRSVAEAIGTFALVFAGCGAVASDTFSGGALGHGGVSAVFGLVIAVMIYATGHISGAHFNPAVTLSFAALGHFSWREVPAYVATQVGAATLAALALGAVFGDAARGAGLTLPHIPIAGAFLVEVVLTFLLMFVIAAVATDARAEGAMAGVAIGGTVALAALFGGPLTGASLNPARTLGPAIAAGNVEALWLYLVGPILGALAGAFAYRFLAPLRPSTAADVTHEDVTRDPVPSERASR